MGTHFGKKRLIFSLLQSDPGPGSYSPQDLTKPEASLRPPFGSTAERFDRHARRFFLGSTVGYTCTSCLEILQRNTMLCYKETL